MEPVRLTQPVDDLARVRQRHHPRCFVSRPAESSGLGVHFVAQPDGSVAATIAGPSSWEGYPGLVHGGIIASLLDGALTNALFARGTVAVTAELSIRYRAPFPLGRTATVTGRVTRCAPRLFVGEACIASEDRIYASCTGKFMRVPGIPESRT